MIDLCMPSGYMEPEKIGGELLQSIMNFSDNNSTDDLSREELFKFYQMYKEIKNK